MSKELMDRLAAAERALAEATKPVRPEPQQVFGQPGIIKGEMPSTSRHFSFTRALGLICGAMKPEHCKLEYDMMEGLRKSVAASKYGFRDDNWAYPASFAHLPPDVVESDAGRQFKSVMRSSPQADPDEMRWLADRVRNVKSYDPVVLKAPLSNAQSYLDDLYGGTLVAPPVQGELIPLMRNMSVMDKVGAQQMALPPQGKIVFPRQATASSAYWITENFTITQSQIQTGQMALEAKKLGVAFVVPNDLFKFASVAADTLLMNDGALSLALKMDASCLYGGGNGEPKGLIRYTGTNELIEYADLTNPTPSGLGANGNTIYPEDAEFMLGLIEDRNFDVDAGFRWIMRGSMWRNLNSVRADAVTAGDEAGPFVTALTRLLSDKVGSNWSGYPVARSAQVLTNYTKGGSGATLTEIFGGMWNQLIIGTYGAVEFARSPGENAFLADQTIIRGILYGDCGYRYPGSYVRYKDLIRRRP